MEQPVFTVGFFRHPEVNIEAGVVTEFDAVPVLRRTGSKLPGMNHDFFLRLRRLFIGKTVIGDRALHDAQLAEDASRGVVVAQQGGRDILFGKNGVERLTFQSAGISKDDM